MKRTVEIGLLQSRSGGYAAIAAASLRGARAAIAAVNADPALSVHLAPVERDPRGQLDLYAPLCRDILAGGRVRHVLGCVTSSSRKEVLPVLERAGATLWYALPYEGFEASDHVAYLHACPNQHLVPLLAWARRRFGRRVHLVGSNYIWGWEIARLAREIVTADGGVVTGDRHLPLGDTDPSRLVEDVAAARPDMVLCSLIGPSQYAFVAAMAARAPGLPILSCNLTECELPMMGAAAEGLIAAGPFFRAPGQADGFGDAHEAAAHRAITEMARLFHRVPGGEHLALADLLARDGDRGPIDPRTHHTALPVLIAQVRDGAFRVLDRQGPVAGDPYLTRGLAGDPTGDPASVRARPSLRVVS